MNESQRAVFDQLVNDVLHRLPMSVRDLFENASFSIQDDPPEDVIEDLGLDPETESLCGLFTGPAGPDKCTSSSNRNSIQIFRNGILKQAGIPAGDLNNSSAEAARSRVRSEIHATLIHELGHHLGLSEADLALMESPVKARKARSFKKGP